MKSNKGQNKEIFFRSFGLACLELFLILLIFGLIAFAIIRPKIAHDSDSLRYNTVINLRFGHYDKSFSQQAIEGVCDSFGISPQDCNGSNKNFRNGLISFGHPNTMSDVQLIDDYVSNFVDLDNTDVFIMSSFSFTYFLCEKVKNYPQIKFVTVGTGYHSESCPQAQNKKWPTNLYENVFMTWLAGYHAALYAGVYALQNPDSFNDYDSNKEGKQIAFAILGGLFIPDIKCHALGFRLGIEILNQKQNKDKFIKSEDQAKKLELLVSDYQTLGSFSPAERGDFTKKLSLKLYEKGVSVVVSNASPLTLYMNSAALEMNSKTGKKTHWVVGADIDQGVAIFNESEEKVDFSFKDSRILTSAIMEIRKIVGDTILEKVQKKILSTGVRRLTTKFNSDDQYDNYYTSIPARFRKTSFWAMIKTKLGPEMMKISPTNIASIEKWVASKDENWLEQNLISYDGFYSILEN